MLKGRLIGIVLSLNLLATSVLASAVIPYHNDEVINFIKVLNQTSGYDERGRLSAPSEAAAVQIPGTAHLTFDPILLKKLSILFSRGPDRRRWLRYNWSFYSALLLETVAISETESMFFSQVPASTAPPFFSSGVIRFPEPKIIQRLDADRRLPLMMFLFGLSFLTDQEFRIFEGDFDNWLTENATVIGDHPQSLNSLFHFFEWSVPLAAYSLRDENPSRDQILSKEEAQKFLDRMVHLIELVTLRIRFKNLEVNPRLIDLGQKTIPNNIKLLEKALPQVKPGDLDFILEIELNLQLFNATLDKISRNAFLQINISCSAMWDEPQSSDYLYD